MGIVRVFLATLAGPAIARRLGGSEVRRAALVLIATLTLMTGSFSISGVALGDVQVTLNCSDGNTATLLVDSETLTELTDAVAAMSGSGLDCTVTQLPVVLSLFGLTAQADSNGSQDFAVGGGQYDFGLCGGFPATVNIGFSAHAPADGSMAETATGSTSETISSPGGPCNGDRRKSQVTCLDVDANVGYMTGTVTQATGYWAGSFTVGLTARDKAEKPDDFNDLRNFDDCHLKTLPPGFDFFHGNIVVKDRN
jgi:hypothetical protein